jgi:hypothetical protein
MLRQMFVDPFPHHSAARGMTTARASS